LPFNGIECSFSDLLSLADYDNRTALHLAASHGHAECTKFLIDSGAPLHLIDRFGRRPLDDAVSFKLPHIAQMIEEAETKEVTSSTRIELLLAASHPFLRIDEEEPRYPFFAFHIFATEEREKVFHGNQRSQTDKRRLACGASTLRSILSCWPTKAASTHISSFVLLSSAILMVVVHQGASSSSQAPRRNRRPSRQSSRKGGPK